MRISDIKNVVTIDQYKSLTRAAGILHISQSALSQSIQRLETEIGCKLFRREKYGTFLTADGEVFVQEGKRILRIYGDMLHHLSGNRNRRTEKVKVGASPMYSKHFFPHVYSEFVCQYANIELRLVEALSTQLWKKLQEHEIDLAITSAPPPQLDLLTIPLYQERVVFSVHKSVFERKRECFYEKDGQEYVDIAAFKDEPFLSYTPHNTMCGVTSLICRDAGFEPNVVFTSGNPEVISSMVAGGMGVAFLPSLALLYSAEQENTHHCHVEHPCAVRDYMITYSKDTVMSHGGQCFVELCQMLHAKTKL